MKKPSLLEISLIGTIVLVAGVLWVASLSRVGGMDASTGEMIEYSPEELAERVRQVRANLKQYQQELAEREALNEPNDGRLGSSYEGCVRKYGEPVSSKPFEHKRRFGGNFRRTSEPPALGLNGTYGFRSGAFAIYTMIVDGLVEALVYSKIGEYGKDRIFDAEATAILEINRQGYVWNKLECPREYRDQHVMNDLWQRSDGVLACYDSLKNELVIIPDEYRDIIFDDGTRSTKGL